MDFTNYFSKIRGAESGNNPNAKNPRGSASGLYQFVESTWKGMGYDWKDRFNVKLQQEAAEKYTQNSYNSLKKFVKGEIKDEDLYGAHFLGTFGYQQLYQSDDNRPMSELVSAKTMWQNESVMMNKDGTPKTVREVKNWLSKKMGGESIPYTPPPSKGSVEQVMTNTFNDPVEFGYSEVQSKPGELYSVPSSEEAIDNYNADLEKERIIQYQEQNQQDYERQQIQQEQQPLYLEDPNLFRFYETL